MNRILFLLPLLFAATAEAQIQIRKAEGTASLTRVPFYLVDVTDGETPEAGLTISGAECQWSENGAAFGNCAGSITDVGSGLYYYVPTSGEIDSGGFGALKIVEAAADTFIGLVQLVEVAEGTAAAGAAGTITLGTNSYADDELNACRAVCIILGTGKGQCRDITDFVASTEVASVSPNWTTTPDNTSQYYIADTCSEVPSASVTAIAAGVLDATASSYDDAGSIGEAINNGGSAGDPWSTANDGSYAPGTFGADVLKVQRN